MPKLFGVDIAKIVNDAVKAAGGVLPGTLTKVTAGTPTAGNLTGGTNPTTDVYGFQGFVERKTQVREGRTLVGLPVERVTIFGGSLPEGIEPTTKDRVAIEGAQYRIVEILDRDPAGATYTCRVE